ncbi:MAG: AAA family ATPase, partial [Candidatus Paceibacterota bacterium]
MKARFKLSTLNEKKESPFGRIIILTGARQTGKTTLAKLCFSDFQYLSIEDPVQRGNYTKLTASQWKLFYPKAILDEVQKEPVLIESIKAVYDQYNDTRYLLLGSSQFLLLQKVKESLAGRCLIEEIYPLTLPELLTKTSSETIEKSEFQKYLSTGIWPETLSNFQLYPDFANRLHVFDYYLKFGGYPALTAQNISNEDRNDWLKNYVRTYLERDVRDLAEFRNLEPFVKTQRVSS